MAHNVTEICLFHLNSPYFCDIPKYLKSMLAFFSLQFAEQCQMEIKTRTKNKRSCRTKSLIYQVKKSSPPEAGIYAISKLVLILKYQKVIFLSTI